MTNWDDLNDGTELPGRTFGPLTLFDVVRYQGASGDLNPHHYDRAILEAAGFERFFSPGMLQAGFLAGLVADELGPERVRRFGVRFNDLVYVGETIRCEARVHRRYEDGDRRLVDLELACRREDGSEAVTGSATFDFSDDERTE